MSTTNFDKQVVADIEFVRSVLPKSYKVSESAKLGSVHCVSKTGFVKPPYEDYGGRLITDAENEIAWQSFMCTIKAHFGKRLQEVDHNTCYNHVDFTIYLRK